MLINGFIGTWAKQVSVSLGMKLAVDVSSGLIRAGSMLVIFRIGGNYAALTTEGKTVTGSNRDD